MNISAGAVYASTCPESPLQGFHRVIQLLPDDDLIVLIEIPSGPRKSEKAKQKNYYYRGFLTRSLNEFNVWKDQKLIVESSLSYPAIWDMEDSAIREAYPPRKGKTESHMLKERDRKWKLIEPLTSHDERNVSINFMELDKKAGELAFRAKVSKGQMLDALHRYYASGCIKNALLSNKFACGAPDVPRIAKNGIKLGRMNAAALVGKLELRGKPSTLKDRENLADGWQMYMLPGVSTDEGFMRTSITFYNCGFTLKFGRWVAELLPAHLRPTKREFCYHGALAKKGTSAARRFMGEGEWLKNHRELIGSARTGVVAFGQVGSIDASPIDVNLVHCCDPLLPIGVGRAVVVSDVNFGLVMGWHVAIGGVGASDANLAILCAATSKAEMLQRYGLEDIPEEDFPYIFFTKYISDNGELRAIEGIGASVEKLGSRIEFIPSGRADLNSVSEAGHHSRNRGLNHRVKGTTKGRQKKRGEPLPITQALLSHYQYMRMLIIWIHWKNTKQQAPHLLTVEMRRENVEPTRIAMYRWAVKKGYVAGKPVDLNHLKAHLLPTFTASIQRNGLVLHRPGKGSTVELLHRARFNSPYLATSGLIRSALNGGKKHIEVKANPDDLSQVILFDQKGIHLINNISDDELLIQEGCVSDLGAMNDTDRLRKVETASEQDQDWADVSSFRIEEQEEAIRKKKEARRRDGQMAKPKTDRSSVRGNQASEKRESLDKAVLRAFGMESLDEEIGHASSEPKEDFSLVVKGEPITLKPGNIKNHLRGSLKRFHMERKAS